MSGSKGIPVSNNHYVVIKREGYTPRGEWLSPLESATRLLSARLWPLWQGTRNRSAIRAGDRIAVYLAGQGGSTVVATARVASLGPWTPEISRNYPLDPDGTAVVVMHLDQVTMLPTPIAVRDRLQALSFINHRTPKWGVAFMGGTRAVSAGDFAVLTASTLSLARAAIQAQGGRDSAIAQARALMAEHGLTVDDILARA